MTPMSVMEGVTESWCVEGEGHDRSDVGAVGWRRRRASYRPRGADRDGVEEPANVSPDQDRVLLSFPEVVQVHGKAGRAETSTDPAPPLHGRDCGEPQAAVAVADRWYSSWAPEWTKAGVLRRVWPDHISYEELVDEMDAASAASWVRSTRSPANTCRGTSRSSPSATTTGRTQPCSNSC